MQDKTVSNASVYTSFLGLADLRRDAREQSPEAIDKVARQFESVFVQMVMKSMRDTVPEGGLFDSESMQFYRDMHDKQLSLHLAEGEGIGLRDVIARQLGGDTAAGEEKPVIDTGLASYRESPMAVVARAASGIKPDELANAGNTDRSSGELKNQVSGSITSKKDFIEKLWPVAEKAARDIGVEPRLLMAQAALESGWGQHMINTSAGNNSHNLFGIKAGGNWHGAAASVGTLEYEAGLPQKKQASFRVYSSYDESFADYVDFVKNNPRYATAIQSAGNPQEYMQALQQSGYATDPHYADKVMNIYRQPELSRASGADLQTETAMRDSNSVDNRS